MMTERKAAKLANGIYEAHKSGKYTDSKAAELLDILSPYFSHTQFCRHLDWLRGVRDCPNFYQKKG
jgi:hypothetical protein